MRRLARLGGAATLAVLLGAPAIAAAQASVGGIALNQLEPAPAGDALFGVPSPSVGGHLVPRAVILFDYAHRPLRLIGGSGDTAVVSSQGFLRLDASLSLWDRLQVSLDMPFAVLQSGDQPGDASADLNAPSSAALGDLRLGARGRLFGGYRDPIQLGIGAYLFVPTGPADSYSGEGAARGAFQALLGGRMGGSIGFVWSATGGVMLRGSDNPQSLTFGAGGAVVLLGEKLQIGPEIYGATQLGGDAPLATEGAMVEAEGSTNLELLLGAKVRPAGGLVIGAAGGPGLSSAIGTPAFRAMAMVGWAPEPSSADEKTASGSAAAGADKDGDGLRDDIDACPDEKGEPSSDPARDGCPPADRDKDGVLDVDDACPNSAGARSADVTKDGCPGDRDGDEIHDGADACPDVKGLPSTTPARNGCPEDRDGDGVADATDACPDQKGVASSEPKVSGCPEDPDGDGVKSAADACPNEKGAASPEKDKSGCPKYVRVTPTEIVILQQVQFKEYGKFKSQTIDPISDELLTEVRDVIKQHPEILKIEVQGHTDDSGDTKFNDWLGNERATQVRQWLLGAGIPAAQLEAKGYGSTVPVADNRIATGRQKNRRVQFMIVSKK